jgi:hypothetical protein
MKDSFKENDFEHFVKQNADQYRMFPSEKVWKGIHNTLHTRRRWYGIGLSLLILTTGVVTWVMLSTTGKNTEVESSLPPVTIQKPVVESQPAARITLAPVQKPKHNTLPFITGTEELEQPVFSDFNPAEHEVVAVSQEPATTYSNTAVSMPEADPTMENRSIVFKNHQLPKQALNSKPASVTVAPVKVEETSLDVPVTADSKEIEKGIEALSNKTHVNDNPFTIESVINSYKHTRRKRNINVLAYITPTISYRELKENKTVINTARLATISAPNPSYAADVNTVVKHKPDIGLQLGISASFPINKRVRVISGLQFNVNKYDIRAYNYPSEITTITLSTAAGGTNSISSLSTYRNTGGTKENWLHNLYFSASVPFGLEVKLLGNSKNYFGMSATAQPTYVLENEAYLLSTDYKNYTEVPSLTRKWNLNAGFEMFAGFSAGHMKWRVGPQVRYQAMSSFQEKYPIKEHLFDFGLKLGVMLNK